ncbi:amino acid transporter [Scopulibacillus daqui]|uniref:Amino acid transporter n=1 Tax=Scopulibacillus daqui TaxID=1469162 RepID=A0ABS2PZ20_9BACL|nr:YtpI family protein [Scopulibacillus daqui]MBM7644805.1 amino acid transporter [Scopulibacillus daqui]
MPTFIILIVLALMAFIFYRIKVWRIQEPYKKLWTSSKAHIAMGAFLFFFGLNRILFRPSKISIIVCAIFMLYGAFIIYSGIKAFRHYLPLAVKEAEDNYRETANNGQ